MKTDDWLQVIAIMVSITVSTISIYLSNKSIKQTEKTLKEANRPYIAIYVDIVDTTFFAKYLVVKNFGKTSAKILKLSFEGLDKDPVNKNRQLQSLVGGTIAPNQKFSSSVDPQTKATIYASISYQSLDGEIYHENFDVKLDQVSDMMWQRDESKQRSDEAKAINNAAHAIVKSLH